MVLPSTIAAWALAVATLVAVGASLVALIQIVALRLDGRRRPPGPVRTIAASGGFLLGMGILLSETVPPARILLVMVAVPFGLWVLSVGRADLAGLLLIGASVPWLVFGTAVLLDQAWFGVRTDLARVLPSMVVATIALLLGVILFENRHRVRSRFEHIVAEGRPLEPGEERRWNTASIAIGDRRWLGLPPNELASSIAILVGAIVTVAAAHGQTLLVTVAIGVIGVVGAAGAAALAMAYVRTHRSRRAFEAFAWMGEWELARIATMNGGREMTTRAAFRRYLRMVPERPDDRWFRVDVLAVEGRLDEAREIALRMPEDGAYERVERAAGLAYVDWLSGGPGDQDSLRAAVEAIRPLDGDERLRAEVVAAIQEVRLRAGRSEADPALPLRTARDRLGPRADGIPIVFARRVLRTFTPLAALLVGGAVAFDHLSLLS